MYTKRSVFDDMNDGVEDFGDRMESDINYLKCAFGQKPTFAQRLDFDDDCDRMIDIGDFQIDALWLWLSLILSIFICVIQAIFRCLCCRN